MESSDHIITDGISIDPKFDDIRPYCDSEIPEAMQRIASSDVFPILSTFVFPEKDTNEVREMLLGIKTCDEFQQKVMWFFNKGILERTIRNFTYSGIEHLSRKHSHLFISNHRDIVLDASILQNVLFLNGFRTSEISFGANLMQGQVAIDIGKANKMYKVERFNGINVKEFYLQSIHLSEYIRYAITVLDHSLWIAQRNGRTKDGNDSTDQGIIKMLGISHRSDKIRSLSTLHIIPIAVSYEWEPCDIQKALELYQSRKEKYTKKPGEDFSSILSGITSYKGDMNISLCPEISEEDLSALGDLSSIEFNKAVALLLDKRIREAYKLYPNNFIAYDLRYGKRKYEGIEYSREEFLAFIEHMKKIETYEVENPDLLKDIFLGIYSNPVMNCSQP